MPDWTDSERLLEHVQNAAKEQQLKLIETDFKPKISEKEARYLQTIADLKAWADKQAELFREENERERQGE